MKTALGLVFMAGLATTTSTPQDERLEQLQALRSSLLEQAPEWERGEEWPAEMLDQAERGHRAANTLLVGCTMLKALEYHRLPESAADVATASYASCQEYRDERMAWTYLTLRARGIVPPANSVPRMIERTEVSEKEQLQAFIMDLRLRPLPESRDNAESPRENETNQITTDD